MTRSGRRITVTPWLPLDGYHCTVEEVEAGMAMKNRDDVASTSSELLELPLASRQDILTVLQTVGTGGTKNGSESKPCAITEKLGPHLLEWHTMAEIVALAGIEKRRTTGTVGGLFGAGKLVTKGAKGPERQYRWKAASRETGMAGGTPSRRSRQLYERAPAPLRSQRQSNGELESMRQFVERLAREEET